VNAALLAQGGGRFRCGKCNKIGNALECLFDEWPAAGEKPPAAGELPVLGLSIDLSAAEQARRAPDGTAPVDEETDAPAASSWPLRAVWMTLGADEPVVETWPALLDDPHQPADEAMNPERLLAVWSGADRDGYALGSVVGTLAVILRTMGRAGSVAEAEDQARTLWDARDRGFLPVP
jgi:hypothetical protein